MKGRAQHERFFLLRESAYSSSSSSTTTINCTSSEWALRGFRLKRWKLTRKDLFSHFVHFFSLVDPLSPSLSLSRAEKDEKFAYYQDASAAKSEINCFAVQLDNGQFGDQSEEYAKWKAWRDKVQEELKQSVRASRIWRLKQQLFSIQQYTQLKLQCSTLANQYLEAVRAAKDLQYRVLEQELNRWKREQQLSNNGASFVNNIDQIQKWCEDLAEIIWASRNQIKGLEAIQENFTNPNPGNGGSPSSSTVSPGGHRGSGGASAAAGSGGGAGGGLSPQDHGGYAHIHLSHLDPAHMNVLPELLEGLNVMLDTLVRRWGNIMLKSYLYN